MLTATQTKADRCATLRAEGARYLRGYLQTGLAGFRQAGLDRIRAAGINTAGCEADDDGIRHLAAMIEAGWCY